MFQYIIYYLQVHSRHMLGQGHTASQWGCRGLR